MSSNHPKLRTTPDHVGDLQVIRQVIAGETHAFEILIERYGNLVSGIVGGKVPQQEAAEVVHRVFIRTYKSLPLYSPKAPFANWLSTLAVRTCYDFWRERYRDREIPLTSFSQSGQMKLMRSAMSDQSDRVEVRDLLNWALDHLGPADRMAVLLVHVEGHSIAETSELLGWSKANVKVRCFRARRKLRRLIRKELNQ